MWRRTMARSSGCRFCSTARTARRRKARQRTKSFRKRRAAALRAPCLMAFRREVSFPAAVRGPVERAQGCQRRRAAACFRRRSSVHPLVRLPVFCVTGTAVCISAAASIVRLTEMRCDLTDPIVRLPKFSHSCLVFVVVAGISFPFSQTHPYRARISLKIL